MTDTTNRPIAATMRNVLLLASLTLGIAACGRGDGEAQAETAPAAMTVGPENIAVVQEAAVTSGPVISGSLAAERDATIRAQIGGAVLETLADQGTRVRRGQLLARLDDSGVRDQFLSARSGVGTAQTSYEIAQRELDRARKLEAGGAIATRDREQAERAHSAASSALADARARFSAAQQQLGHTRITAPFDGVVSVRQASAGDVLTPGAPVMTVVDPSTMRLEASVPAAQIGAVRIGMPVAFTVAGYEGRQFTGRVTRLSPSADAVTRQVPIVVSIPNSGNALVAGLFAEGRVSSEQRTAPMLPASAVNQAGAQPMVLRVKGGIAEAVPVHVGIADDTEERIEITGGLAIGDTVLVGAAQGITPGTPVRIGAVTDTRAATGTTKN
jgi:membrane fusion protein (multidrug efflux system)